MIILGSNSETRSDILKKYGIEFLQKGCGFDEDSIQTSSPKTFVLEATLGKLKSCVKKFGLGIPILVADTVVTAHGKILRKAKNRDDAKQILLSQSSSKVSIITAMILKTQDSELIDISSTDYIFSKFQDQDLENFLNSGDWEGKAGACMVEGFCKKYVQDVKGFESCAMGLSIEKLKLFL